MARSCEVCTSLTASTGALVPSKSGRLRRMVFDDRIIALCEEHALEIRENDLRSLEAVQEHFLEPFPGQRSLVSRRSPMERRVFPARPEGRRAADGRRAGDKLD